MRYVSYLTLFQFLLMPAFTQASEPTPPPLNAPAAAKLIFDDEFDSLDLSRYTTLFFWGNRWLTEPIGELQVYVDPAYSGTHSGSLGLNPFTITNGVLHIQAAIPRPTVLPYLEGQKYTSGILTTYNSFSHRYGYFELRARLPRGKGYHPTFWLLPKVIMDEPPELDICETLGDQLTTLYLTAHWNDATNRPRTTGTTVNVEDLSLDFHRYGLLWTKTWVAWYLDGSRLYYSGTPNGMDAPMYMLINLAVGGRWATPPDSTTPFPGDFAVDYIRVYDAP